MKSFKARGKRLTTYTIGEVEELEPKEMPVEETPAVENIAEEPASDFVEQSDDEIRDELTGQQRLFD